MAQQERISIVAERGDVGYWVYPSMILPERQNNPQDKPKEKSLQCCAFDLVAMSRQQERYIFLSLSLT